MNWKSPRATWPSESLGKFSHSDRHPDQMSDQDSLRYPIGAFAWPTDITGGDRREFIREIAELPRKLREATAGLNDAQLDTPYRPGGWTVRQVVHHIADSHIHS